MNAEYGRLREYVPFCSLSIVNSVTHASVCVSERGVLAFCPLPSSASLLSHPRPSAFPSLPIPATCLPRYAVTVRGRWHRRLGDLVGQPLLFGPEVRIMVNRAGDEVQLVRFSPDFRAEVETVPPADAADPAGWIRAAERLWLLTGYEWRFEERAGGP